MDSEARAALNRSLPRLVSEVKVNTSFKAALVAENIFPDDFLDDLFCLQSSDEMVLKLVQRLKKMDEIALNGFMHVLARTQHGNLAEHVQTFRGDSVRGDKARSRLVQASDSDSSRKLEKNDESPEAPGSRTTCDQRGPIGPAASVASGASSRTLTHRWASAAASTFDGTVEDLRRALLQCGPATTSYERISGQIVLKNSYVEQVAKFELGMTDSGPGPIQGPDLSLKAINYEHVRIISPEHSAHLGRLLGGKPDLTVMEGYGCQVFSTLDGSRKYVGISFYISSKEKIGFYWLSHQDYLVDCVADAIGFYPRRIRYYADPERLVGDEETVDQFMRSEARKVTRILIDVD